MAIGLALHSTSDCPMHSFAPISPSQSESSPEAPRPVCPPLPLPFSAEEYLTGDTLHLWIAVSLQSGDAVVPEESLHYRTREKEMSIVVMDSRAPPVSPSQSGYSRESPPDS